MTEHKDVINHIHPNVLLQKMKVESLNIIDVREPFELQTLPFLGARNIPLNTLLRSFHLLLDLDETYYIICHHGQRSYYVTEFLHNKGYNVINVIGGVDLVN